MRDRLKTLTALLAMGACVTTAQRQPAPPPPATEQSTQAPLETSDGAQHPTPSQKRKPTASDLSNPSTR